MEVISDLWPVTRQPSRGSSFSVQSHTCPAYSKPSNATITLPTNRCLALVVSSFCLAFLASLYHVPSAHLAIPGLLPLAQQQELLDLLTCCSYRGTAQTREGPHSSENEVHSTSNPCPGRGDPVALAQLWLVAPQPRAWVTHQCLCCQSGDISAKSPAGLILEEEGGAICELRHCHLSHLQALLLQRGVAALSPHCAAGRRRPSQGSWH